jgi:phytol kinase
MSWTRELLGAGALAGIFAAVLAAAELWARRGSPKPEWTRKLVHVGGGLGCLGFPFLVSSPWTVLVMATGLSALFAAGRRGGALRSLHGVERRTSGSEYYPLAIFLTYVLTYGRPWLFVSSVLTLAVADAGAALVGGRWGRVRYQVEEEEKSLEGSLAFLLIAFLAVLLPALLLAGLPGKVCLLSALLVAVLVTGFEAISLHGADNLFVPVAVCVALGKISTKPLAEIAYQNASLAGIAVALALLAWRTRAFNFGARIVFLLYAYGAWALGSWQWALPVFVGLAAYLLLEVISPLPPERVGMVRVRTMSAVLLPPFLVLVLANSRSEYGRFFGPYLAANASVLAMALWAYLRHRHPRAAWRRVAGATVTATFAAAAVLVALWRMQKLPPRTLLAAAVPCLLAAILGALWSELRRARPDAPAWGADKMLLPLVAAGAVLWMQEAGMVGVWSPAG